MLIKSTFSCIFNNNFINPHTGAQTQTIIECLRRYVKIKCNIKSRGATNLIERQLQVEWFIRSVNTTNVFESFLRDIKDIFV